MVLARHERTEEPALGDELSAVKRTLLVDERGQIVRGLDERLVVDGAQRLVERAVEILEHALPAERAVFDFVELALHVSGEADIEFVRELLDHHLLHRFAQRRREEAALLEFGVMPVRQRRDD